MASKRCSELGLKTLLVDRKLEIGAPVKDFEVISSGDLRNAGIALEDHWLAAKIRKVRVHFGKNETILVLDEDEIYSIEADKFIKHLAALSSQAGTDIMIRTEAVAPIIESGVVSGIALRNGSKDTVEKCGMVIYAGGYDSQFLKQFPDLVMPHSTLLAKILQERIIGNLENLTEAVIDISDDMTSVTAIIPKGGRTANAAIIYRPHDIDPRSEIQHYLSADLKLERYGSIQEVRADIFRRQRPVRIGVPGLILAGDAAGISNHLWPFGIGKSMLSGKAAADAAFEASGKEGGEIAAEYMNILERISGSGRTLRIMEELERMDADMLSDRISSLGSEKHLKGQLDPEGLLAVFL
jgi:digeranylgeranylglycerophospholipid reductase